MKNLFYIFIFLFIGMSLNAQELVSNVDSSYVKKDSSFYGFYNEYSKIFDSKDEDKITYNRSYRYFIDPINYWYDAPYIGFTVGFGFGFGFGFGYPYYYGYPYYPYYYPYSYYGWYYPYYGWYYPYGCCWYGYGYGRYYPPSPNPHYGLSEARYNHGNGGRGLGSQQPNTRTSQYQGTKNYRTNVGYQNRSSSPKYSRGTQNYYSPSYRQSKTSKEYYNRMNHSPNGRTMNPGYKSPQNRYTPANNSRQRSTPNYSSPSNNRYSNPSRVSPSNRSYSSPHSSPSRSYSTPSSPSRSYSTPSRSYSSPSYSPSRSYSIPSGGGGMRSGGGYGGGGSRSTGGGGRR